MENKPEKRELSIKCETGRFELTGQPVAVIIDGPDRVLLNDFKGQATAERNADGDLRVAVSGNPARGRKNETRAIDTLAEALGIQGRPVQQAVKADCERSEADGFIEFKDGTRAPVQVVSVPADAAFGAAAATTGAEVNVSPEDAVKWIDDAIRKKVDRYADKQRGEMLLALDMRHVGLLADQSFVRAYRDSHGDPAAHGFKDIWLVGPVVARVIRLD